MQGSSQAVRCGSKPTAPVADDEPVEIGCVDARRASRRLSMGSGGKGSSWGCHSPRLAFAAGNFEALHYDMAECGRSPVAGNFTALGYNMAGCVGARGG